MATSDTLFEPSADPERYTLLRLLGSGASGAVYLARDAETGGEVALKKLFKLDQKSVQRFKREFRALTDLHHPNLVKLFDLQRGSDTWFITMEYVEGVELTAHLREQAAQQDALATGDGAVSSQQLALLLRVFHELAGGIHALHGAGLLHRDLKPSNVLISRDGRVVVLDFGLVRELHEGMTQVTNDGTVAGTPAYMAPEQALGETLSEAADWYAFGVMLYESLSGVLPVDDRNVARLLHHKLNRDPLPLSHRQLGVPRDLTDLCLRLLHRDAGKRPPGQEVIAIFAGLRADGASHVRSQPSALPVYTDTDTFKNARRAAYVGRDPELEQLTAALECARMGRTIVFSVRGSSGSGKTALVEHFLRDAVSSHAPGRDQPLVLRSRCYERESMPFKALDGAIDALVRFLSGLDEIVVAHMLPRSIVELTQLFPGFQRLPAARQLLNGRRPHADAARTRQLAEQGLRALIARVADLRPVVLWVDDLQWGDLDSANVLREWFGAPSSAAILVLLSYRSEELETSACLRVIGPTLLAGEPQNTRGVIELLPLRDADIRALCAQRLETNVPPALIERITTESHGNPFWALQLSALAHVQLGRGDVHLDDVSMSELVLRASALLPPAARRLLDVLAIAGRPMSPQLALQAANIEQDGRTIIHALQQLRLLRSPVVNGERLLEVYHDRVREAVQAALADLERQRVQERLLQAAELSGHADANWLHELALGAGVQASALRYGLLAAERAQKNLAFERAIDLYQRCLELTLVDAERAKLWSTLASVLARSRRGAEAADAYLRAAELVEEHERFPLLRLAASHMLRTGRFDEGEQLVQRVLAVRNISVPKSEIGLYAAIGLERARSWLLFTVEPDESDDSKPAVLRTGELYGYLSVETQFYAPLRAALFQARALRMSLRSRHPLHQARALCLKAVVSCLAGTERAAQSVEAQLIRAEELASQVDSQDLRVELLSARSVCGYLLGKNGWVLEASDDAMRLSETRRTGGVEGDYYYLFAVQSARIGALQHLGRYGEAHAELQDLLARAEATGNRTAALQITLSRTVSEIVLDRGHESRPRLDRERLELPRFGIGILHLLHLAAVIRVAADTHEFEWAEDVIKSLWEPCMKSPLRHSALLCYLLRSFRARLLLNRYVLEGRNGDPAAIVREDLRAMRNMGFGRGIEARVAYLRGDIISAVAATRESMQLFAARNALEEVARQKHVLGHLLGGEQGAQLIAEAVAESLSMGVASPLAMLRGSNPEIVIDAETHAPGGARA